MAVTCVSNLGGGTGNWSSDDTWTIAGQGAVIGHGASIVSTTTVKRLFTTKRRLTERPDGFVLNKNHPLYGSVAFAGLGGMGFGSGRYHDSSMYSNHGTIVGYEDKWGRELGRNKLSASSQYVIFPITTSLRPSIKFTMLLWGKNLSGFAYDNSASATGFFCRVSANSTSIATYIGSPIFAWKYAAAMTLPTNVFNHIGVVYDSQTITSYLNGIGTTPTAAAGGVTSYSQALTIFGSRLNGVLQNTGSGTLADVMLFSTNLSPSTIDSIADPSNVMLDTGGGNCLILPPKRRIFKSAGGTLTANIGSGATLNITVASTVINGVTSIGSTGTGYPLSSTIRLRVTGGSGNCGIIEVDTNGSGGVSAFRSIIAGGTGYSATNAATTIDWTAWTSSALIGHKVKISGTWYPISGNTATALTLPGWQDVSTNNVSWTLGGTPLSGDSAFVGNGSGALFNITANTGGAIIGAVNAVSYNSYPVSSTLNLGIFDPAVKNIRSIKRRLTERPDGFVFNKNHPLYGSIAFAGLGGMGFGTNRYHDSSMYGNHGALNGYTGAGNTPGDRWSREIGRNSLSFNGSTDYALFYPEMYAYVSWPITVMTFFKVSNVTTSYPIVYISNDSINISVTSSLSISGDLAGDPIIAKSKDGSNTGYAQTATSFIANSWQHAAGVFISPFLRHVYLNGSGKGTNTTTIFPMPPTKVEVGAWVTPGNYLLGSLADLLIFNKEIGQSTIASFADPSNVMLDTGGGNCLIIPPKRIIFKSAGSGGIISVLTNASGGISTVLSVVTGGAGYATKTNNSTAYASLTLVSTTDPATGIGDISSAAIVSGGSAYGNNLTFNVAVTTSIATSGGARGILSVNTNGSGVITSVNSVVSSGMSYWNSSNYYLTNSYSTDTYDTVIFDTDISTIPLFNLTINGTLTAKTTTTGIYHLKTTGTLSGNGTMIAGTSIVRYPSNCTFIYTSTGVYGTAAAAATSNYGCFRFQLWAQKPAITYCRLGSPFKTFTTSGGRGSGCTITITQTGGVITGHTLVAAGTLYPLSSTVYLNITNGSGTNGYISVQTDGSGTVSSINGIINGGTGYINTTGATTASYGVFHVTAHGYPADQPVRVFQGTGGLLPVGGTIATPIYTTFYELTTLYIKTVIDADSFTLALTSGGTVLQISALSSGTNSITKWGELAGATTIDVKAYDLPDVNGGNGPSSYPMSEGTAIDLTSDPKWAGGASVAITKNGTYSVYHTITGTTATTINIYPGLAAATPAFNAIGLLTRNVKLNNSNIAAAGIANYLAGNLDVQITSISPITGGRELLITTPTSFCGSFSHLIAMVNYTVFGVRNFSQVIIFTVRNSFMGRAVIYPSLMTTTFSMYDSLIYAENSNYIVTTGLGGTLSRVDNCIILNGILNHYNHVKDSLITYTNCLNCMSGGYGHGGSTGKFIANNCITQMTTAVNASYYQNVYFNNCQFNYMTSASSNGLSVFKNCSFNVATITTGMGIQYGNIYAEDCTFNRIPLGLYECRGELVNCTFSKGGVASTTDISQTSDLLLIGCTLGGDSQCDMVGKNSIKRNEKVVALNIGGVSGSHKSWLTQGYIASDTGTPYGPLSSTLKFTPSSATYATYWDEQIYCPANKYTYIDVYMKQSVTGMSEIPKCQLIDPSDTLLTGTPISTISMIDDLNWQHFLISYKPTYSRFVYLRIRGANATGNWWAGYVVRET